MLCSVLLFSKMNQLYICTFALFRISLPFRELPLVWYVQYARTNTFKDISYWVIA